MLHKMNFWTSLGILPGKEAFYSVTSELKEGVTEVPAEFLRGNQPHRDDLWSVRRQRAGNTRTERSPSVDLMMEHE